MNSGEWRHWDTKAAIKDIEDHDIGYLVDHGIAELRNEGDRLRVYEIFLAPGTPNSLKDKDRCKLHFWYGAQSGKAQMWCKRCEFEALSNFLLDGNGHRADRCWRQRVPRGVDEGARFRRVSI